MRFDCAIVGGGIVGLSVAMMLGRRRPGMKIVLFEKEGELAHHQTGRNSGVIHSGIYYKPGSLKARFAREGNQAMLTFCQEHGILHEVCGKVIVATSEEELPRLEILYRRGLENGLEVAKLAAEEVREVEPHVSCLAGISVPSTGIVNYRSVCLKLAELVQRQGGVVKTGVACIGIRREEGAHFIETSEGPFQTRFVVNCGGLQSDRIARQAGLNPEASILPFRGEYFELVPEKRYLVKTLIYPVPDPEFPFLGVHLTRMIDGSIHAGPNAVLAFKREGYRKTDVDLADLYEILTFPGFWKMARKHFRMGLMEMYRSVSRKAFLESLQRLVPEIADGDLVPAHSGVRAQALMPDGRLVDDFLIVNGRDSIHVCNAPSPAATASLKIGEAVAEKLLELSA